ncbi:MAG: ATP-grasp domain-containing protein [Gracilimonas sp.]|nr:ATP-grasp domain-containing protein [Gracilimonas sp.]
MRQHNHSVLLLGGELKLGLPVIRCLGEVPELSIHYAAREKTSTRFSRYLNSYLELSGENEAEQLKSLKDIIHETGSDVLLPIDEPSAEFVIKYKNDLSPVVSISPLPDLDTLHQVIRKNVLNEWLEEHDLPFAKIWKMPSRPKETLPESLTFPILLKPVWDRGGDADGINVRMFDDRQEMDAYIEEHKIDTNNYLLQEYIPGYDIDCSLLCKEGKILAHTLQKGFILQDLQYSPGIELLHKPEFLEQIELIISKLNWSGICHLDFRYDGWDKTYKLVDFNARYWTTLLGSLVAAGVNFPYLAYQSALGETFPVPEYENIHFVLTITRFKGAVQI